MKIDNELIAKFNVIFKPFEGEENLPHLIELPKEMGIQEFDANPENKKNLENRILSAKANVVPFRKEDRKEVVNLVARKYYDGNLMWTIDFKKIYSIERGYEIKEECEMCRPDFNCAEYHQENNCSMIQKFAILLKEETVKEFCERHAIVEQTLIDIYNLHLKRALKEAEKEESQSELWSEVKKSLSTSGLYWLANVMRDYHITRIK